MESSRLARWQRSWSSERGERRDRRGSSWAGVQAMRSGAGCVSERVDRALARVRHVAGSSLALRLLTAVAAPKHLVKRAPGYLQPFGGLADGAALLREHALDMLPLHRVQGRIAGRFDDFRRRRRRGVV